VPESVFRLRHDPVDQSRKNADEAVELGQHLLWQTAFPLPVGLNEGEAKGALGKFPMTDVPGDPHHPTPAAHKAASDSRRLRLAAQALG
jgi:hypothetical protein